MPSAVHISLTRLTCLDNSQAFVRMFVPRFLSVSLLGFFPFFCPFQDLFSRILSFPCVLCVLCLGAASSENHHNYPFKYLLHKYTTKLLVVFFFMCINVSGCIHSMQKKHLLPVSDMDEF